VRKEFSTRTKALAFQRSNGRCEECGMTRTSTRTYCVLITAIQMVSLVLMILATAVAFVSLATAKRQEMMSETLLKQSGGIQDILAQRLHETHCQVENYRNGNGN
jgi:hypothetical protein